MSAKTGFAPIALTALAVATKVNGGIMTSSPAETPHARRARISASVPEATPIPYAAPLRPAISVSSAAPWCPKINCCEAMTCSIAARISSPMAAYCAARSSCGTARKEEVVCVCSLIDQNRPYSFAEIQKSEQENPQAVHEMPVVRGNFGGDGARHFGLFKFAEGDVEQRANSA